MLNSKDVTAILAPRGPSFALAPRRYCSLGSALRPVNVAANQTLGWHHGGIILREIGLQEAISDLDRYVPQSIFFAQLRF